MDISVHTGDRCTGCGTCSTICPRVFHSCRWTGMTEVISGDFSDAESEILVAASSCPTCNIRVERDGVPIEQSFRNAPVAEVTRLCADVIELCVGAGTDEFVPGQHVTFALKDRKGEFYRAYSIVSATPEQLTFCIKLDPKGRAGRALGRLEVGNAVRISESKGTFSLMPADSDGARSRTFIATGTGIAPILPMIRSIPDVPKRVLFGVRHEHDLFYVRELADVPNTDVRVTLSRPGTTWDGHRGRVTDHIESLDLSPQDEVYLCGNPNMVSEVVETLQARGHSPDAIVSERYSTSAAAASGNAALSTWQAFGLLARRVHFYASIPLVMLFVFYAVTGFIGNRIDLFLSEDAASIDGDTPAAQELSVPEELPLTADAILPWLVHRHGGHIDLEAAEEDEEFIICDSESVWGARTFTVDKPSRTYSVESRRARWAGALVNLHRGKHAGWMQKLVVDAAALVLILVSVTGAVMVVQARARPRQQIALCVLSVLSVLLLVVFLVNR